MMNKLKIGWAVRDIGTDEPVSIPGQLYIRVSQGVRDPIYVTALAVDDGTDTVIFLSADTVIISSGLLDEVREAVKNINPSIPVDKIIMNATHTHAAPSHFNGNFLLSYEGIPDVGIKVASGNDYRHFFALKSAEAVCEAYEGRESGGISYGYGYAVAGHNRRAVYFDDVSKRAGKTGEFKENDVRIADSPEVEDGAQMYGDAGFSVDGNAQMYGETNDDNFSHYETGADHFINLFFTFDSDNNLTGSVINVPCPSQNSEYLHQISADFWNDVRIYAKERYGDIFILPQCAAAGDLSPRILHYKKAQERRFRLKYGDNIKQPFAERKDIAQRIMQAFDEVYSWAKKDIKTEAKIIHEVRVSMLAKRIITDEEYAFVLSELKKLLEKEFKTGGETPEKMMAFNSLLQVGRKRYKDIVERFDSQKTETRLPTEVHAVRIGDIAFASNQFEMYMDYMHRIQARSPFEQTFVIQLAGTPGDNGGTYLATERGAEDKGYSACLFDNLVSPEGGQELVDETVKILKDIYIK